MRVRTWNAYASNNSGSYTIVGSLPSEQVASELAAELAAMCAAHAEWTGPFEGSPLMQLCRKYSLGYEGTNGDDWPEYGGDNAPQVIAVGAQIIVHHHYTLDLPRAIGELFYKCGGRVRFEKIHAHNPMAIVADFWWGWQKDDMARQAKELPGLITAITAEGAALHDVDVKGWPAAWRTGHDHVPFTLGVVFPDLVAGAARLDAIAKERGAKLALRVFEIADRAFDPFPHLRPSDPRLPRYDIVITHAGDNRATLVAALVEALGYDERTARALLAQPAPLRVARGVGATRADSIAERLRGARALADIVQNAEA